VELAWVVIVVAGLVWFTFVILFTPRIDYRVTNPLRPDSAEFVHVVQATCQASVHGDNSVEILTNAAQFEPGEVAGMLADAMMARARAGVEVRLVLDSIGSAMAGAAARRLREAGCQVRFYQPITWYRLHRLNNRSHRELLIVDGRTAFTGGAGVADWWFRPMGNVPAWRDTMARIEGPIVTALQGVFAENWLECGGDILTSPRDWPQLAPTGTTDAMLVKSSPSDRATVSRVVFQMLIEGAVSDIDISTPYFLPDRALRRSLAAAAGRGVRVRVIVPGPLTDQRFVRLASRRLYGELLDHGVHVHEYRPAMTHVKALLVDGIWALIGTTNVDNRSFEHNDEVNVAFRDRAVHERLRRDFESDLAASDEVTADRWHRRPWFEKLVGPAAWILERQQ
jgi:cardiolipin synthase